MFKFFTNKIQSLFRKKSSSSFLEEAESLFYEGDFGSELTEILCCRLKQYRNVDEEVLRSVISSLLRETIQNLSTPATCSKEKQPFVSVIVGTNGTGKTTTVAKLAHFYQSQGKKVMIVATDTFRSAGIEQMRCWAEVLNCGFVAGKPGGDPAAIAFDGIASACAKQYDHVIIDTSGRLHTYDNLLKELSKLVSVCNKALSGSPHEILMIIDATLGGNVIEQVRIFHNTVPLTGLILTKTDGSAKGGTLFRLAKQFHLPTKFVGYGEGLEDFEAFAIDRFLTKILP